MRKIIQEQALFGTVDIGEIQFDLRCRDEIPKVLIGLQHIYVTPGLRKKVFDILEEIIPDEIDRNDGRPGMELWQILVAGSLKLNCNWNYDHLQEIVNNHKTIRRMLGLSDIEEERQFPLSTLKANVSLLTPAVLNKINEAVVKYCHNEIVIKKNESLRGQCDSFVVKTNVHYPTDINLLFDAMRKIIFLSIRLCIKYSIPGWRQGSQLLHTIKRLFRRVQNAKSAKGKVTNEKIQQIEKLHMKYIGYCMPCIKRANETLEQIIEECNIDEIDYGTIDLIRLFINDAERQIDQIERRISNGEKIRHDEKIFSLFERHTEWISKGKAGVPQELGLRVSIMRDQYGFLLGHKVMEKMQDIDVAVPFTKEIKNSYKNLKSCGYDKGYWSPENFEALKKVLNVVIMPRKGRLSEEAKKIEAKSEFKEGKKEHSVVESSISALDNHGLNLCRDKKIVGFKRYVALAILARNIQMMGHLIQQQNLEVLQKKEKKERIAAA
jgi:hypothetical protein